MIGFLDESSVADCTRKSRVINTKKISTPNTYRSRRLFSLFGFLGWGGKSLVQTTQSCKKEDFLEFLKQLRRAFSRSMVNYHFRQCQNSSS